MGRVYSEVKVDTRSLWALFDTGSRNSYVTRHTVDGLPLRRLPVARFVGLEGEHRNLEDICDLLGAEIEGKTVDLQAYVIENLGQADNNRPLDMIFGALAMQQWGIHPVPEKECLDLSMYPKEFIEY